MKKTVVNFNKQKDEIINFHTSRAVSELPDGDSDADFEISDRAHKDI